MKTYRGLITGLNRQTVYHGPVTRPLGPTAFAKTMRSLADPSGEQIKLQVRPIMIPPIAMS